MLYIVATPIGNLRYISLRALQVLKDADMVAAEDTRHTGLLLKAYGLKKPLVRYFAHNEERQSQRILEALLEGKTVALVSDAGTPGISDPGARLIRRVIQAGIKLTVIPGPVAGITALVASGLDTDVFAFGGFFPRNTKERKVWLERLGTFKGTLVFYESPKRLSETLGYLYKVWGDRYCCVARELTKRFETFIRGRLTEVAEELGKMETIKGEIVVVMEGCPDPHAQGYSPEEAEELGRALLAGGMYKKEASLKLAKITGIPAKACYAMLVKQKP